MANIRTNTTNSMESTALSMYLKDIERIPLIGRDEEYDLAIRAKNGDSLARERLVEKIHNYRSNSYKVIGDIVKEIDESLNR